MKGGSVNIVVYCQPPGCRRFNNPKRAACYKCGRPVRRLREKVFYLDYREPGGKRVRERVGVSTNQEEAHLRAKEVGLHLGRLHRSGGRRTLGTLGELAEWYLTRPNVRKLKTLKRNAQCLKNITRVLGGDQKITNLHLGMVEAYQEFRLAERVGRRKQTTADSTINRETIVLSRAFNLAVKGKLLRENPIEGYESLKENNGRERILEREEYQRLLKNSLQVPHLHDIIIVAVYTGMRSAEVTGLRHSEIDWRNKFIRLPAHRTKTVARIIPMFPQVAEVLKRYPRVIGIDHVFLYEGKPIKSVKTSFANSCRLAGIKGLWFHDLRRTFINRMARRGYPERLIMKIVGHKTRSAFDRYRHVDDDEVLAIRFSDFWTTERGLNNVMMDSKVDSS